MNTSVLTQKLTKLPMRYNIDIEEIKRKRKLEKERLTLTDMLALTGKELELERENFKEALDTDLIDFYSYMILAKEAKYKFILKQIKEFDECIMRVNEFLPYVDNWSVCDSMKPKCFKNNKEKLIFHIDRWLMSEHTYTVRFGIKALMDHFLDADFRMEYANEVANVRSGDYYIDMMRAWYFATALVKQWENIIPIMESGVLDKWTHNKAIQKAIESYRITEDEKTYLRNLKKG